VDCLLKKYSLAKQPCFVKRFKMPMKWSAVNFEKEKSNREKERVEHENEGERVLRLFY